MTTTEAKMDVFAASKGPVIGTDSAGSSWVGTKCWLIRADSLSTPTPEQMDTATGGNFTVPLTRVCHGSLPVVVEGHSDVTERGYERPDGITVWVDDAIASYFESYFESEDEENGYMVRPDFVVRQTERRFGSVGFFLADVLVAVVMPIHHINEHLTDGKGGVL